MTLDISALREETLGCRKGLVHLNNAGSSLPPDPVLNAVTDHLRLEAEIGGYEAKDQNLDKIEFFYEAAAKSVGGNAAEIAFIENATRAWDMAFYAFDWKAGDEILTSAADYNSNMIAYLQVATKYGVELVIVPDDETGGIDPTALEGRITPKTRLISISHIPTNNGLIAPVEEIGRITQSHGIPFLLDACQSVGQMPIDVTSIGCDILTTTGRKYIRGPRGTGFLWMKKEWVEILEPPFLDNHAARWTGVSSYEIREDARRFENWEAYYAGKLGLGVALDYGNKLGAEATWDRISALSARLRDGLDNIQKARQWDTGTNRSGLVLFNLDGLNSRDVVKTLRDGGLNCSASDAQLTRKDLADAGVSVMIRASVHYFNTEDEVDLLLNRLENF